MVCEPIEVYATLQVHGKFGQNQSFFKSYHINGHTIIEYILYTYKRQGPDSLLILQLPILLEG